MRRKHDVRKAQERIVRWNRLLVEDVEARARKVAALKRVYERRLVDQRGSRCVDQEAPRFHQREALAVEQVARVLAHPQMQTYNI